MLLQLQVLQDTADFRLLTKVIPVVGAEVKPLPACFGSPVEGALGIEINAVYGAHDPLEG